MIKIFISLFFLLLTINSHAGTCTTTSRTNYTSGQVLTSTALNADFNQLVSKVNSLDGGCISDGTIEFSALNSADFSTIVNGVHQGCGLSYSDANTISVGRCIATVNGFSIKTTTSTNVTWGCSGCSSENPSTLYYVYIKTGSTGTTLNLSISTSAPNSDGYNGSGDKVIGKFINNSSSAIDEYSVESWNTNTYSTSAAKTTVPGATAGIDTFSVSYGTTNINTICTGTPCFIDQIGNAVASITRSGTGAYALVTNKTYVKLKCALSPNGAGEMVGLIAQESSCNNCSGFSFTTVRGATDAATDSNGTFICQGSYN